MTFEFSNLVQDLLSSVQIAPIKADRVWALAAVTSAVAIPLALTAGRFDQRRISGDPVWSKPFKFALALAIHFFTFAIIAYALPKEYLDYAGMQGNAYASTLAGALELAYISIQAARGRHSHFNTMTLIETVAASLMGVGAIMIITPAIYLGSLLIFYAPVGWSPATVVGCASGLLGGAFLTLITAMRMGQNASRFADTKIGSDQKMPLTGWSYDRADLRPSHFL